MTELCARIQEEKDYQNFSAMLHELSELIERKEQRRFPNHPKVVWKRNRPWVSMPATANKILPSTDGPNQRVEISIPAADVLFREIRIENRLIGMDGEPVALITGARLTVTLEAETGSTVRDTNSV